LSCRSESDASWRRYLIVLRHRLPIVHEEDFQRVRHGQSHLRPSRSIVVIPPPLGAAPALLPSPSSRLWASSRRGGFRSRGAGRSGSGLRPGEVLLEGQVGLVEFEEARRGDPFVPPASKKREKKKTKGESQRRRVLACTHGCGRETHVCFQPL
jgi:hypothetical protein